MCIGESYAHTGQTFHLGRMDLDFIAITGEVLIRAGVPQTHVIGQHKHDIRTGACHDPRDEQEDAVYTEENICRYFLNVF